MTIKIGMKGENVEIVNMETVTTRGKKEYCVMCVKKDFRERGYWITVVS
jgi:hypothetical protein